jgi:hypothetical protein
MGFFLPATKEKRMTDKSLSALLPQQGNLSKTSWQLPDNMTETDWKQAGFALSKIEGAMAWWIGDWWAFGEHKYGDRKALVESEEWEGPAYNSCNNAAIVCRKFETTRRRVNLGFGQHEACSSLPPDEADKVLDWAEAEGASVKSTREKVKQVKAWLAQGWTQDQLRRREQIEAGYAVVASQRTGDDGKCADAALIAWADQQGLMVKVDRNTDWGNPFEMPGDGDRNTVIHNYAYHYYPHKPSLHRKIANLKGKVLVCWCYPESCHADHLASEANDL